MQKHSFLIRFCACAICFLLQCKTTSGHSINSAPFPGNFPVKRQAMAGKVVSLPPCRGRAVGWLGLVDAAREQLWVYNRCGHMREAEKTEVKPWKDEYKIKTSPIQQVILIGSVQCRAYWEQPRHWDCACTAGDSTWRQPGTELPVPTASLCSSWANLLVLSGKTWMHPQLWKSPQAVFICSVSCFQLIKGTIKSHIHHMQNHCPGLTVWFMIYDTFISKMGLNIYKSLCCPHHDDVWWLFATCPPHCPPPHLMWPSITYTKENCEPFPSEPLLCKSHTENIC